MSGWQIAACGVLYLWASYDLYRARQPGLSVTFFAYALANVGLIWAARNGAA